jgi:hypothetical protein
MNTLLELSRQTQTAEMDADVRHSGGLVTAPIVPAMRQTLHLHADAPNVSHRVSDGILRARLATRISLRKNSKRPISAPSVAFDATFHSA